VTRPENASGTFSQGCPEGRSVHVPHATLNPLQQRLFRALPRGPKVRSVPEVDPCLQAHEQQVLETWPRRPDRLLRWLTHRVGHRRRPPSAYARRRATLAPPRSCSRQGLRATSEDLRPRPRPVCLLRRERGWRPLAPARPPARSCRDRAEVRAKRRNGTPLPRVRARLAPDPPVRLPPSPEVAHANRRNRP
jgi:hypothetical protein